METVGQTARRLREEQNLTRRELEDLSGVSQRAIEYLEKDKKDPRRGTLEALAGILGPELLQAAFPDVAILARRGASSKNRATGRNLRDANQGMDEETFDVALANA
jgi:transcriptional regulator with XRE-family HTH domain